MAAAIKPVDSKRRRFQPPITTFFTPSADSHGPSTPSHLSYNHYSAITNSPTPVVPAKVQASLLSVGMRVRKSIADGYKTNHAKAEEHILPEDNSSTLKARTTTTYNIPTARPELAPFSGMAKSNDYHTPQPLPLPHSTTK